MKRRLFGKDDDQPSREDLEREAAAELNRLTRQAGGPPGGAGARYGGAGPSTPAPRLSPPPPRSRPLPNLSSYEHEDEEDRPFSMRAEEEAVTELALRDWAVQSRRSSFEDLALVGIDRSGAEAMRDRALRDAVARGERMAAEISERRAEVLRNSPELAQQLTRRVNNANFARPDITWATGAAAAARVTSAKQQAVTDAMARRDAAASKKAAGSKSVAPPLTPAARRAKAAAEAAAKSPARAPAKATKTAARIVRAPAPPPERPPLLLTPAARRAKAAAEAEAAAAAKAAATAARVAKAAATRAAKAAAAKATSAPTPAPTRRAGGRGSA